MSKSAPIGALFLTPAAYMASPRATPFAKAATLVEPASGALKWLSFMVFIPDLFSSPR
ncbi:hypothetical protein [Pseudoalteromonas piscicida]|uniref:hypothetical protein n=1 Tax=Pseudoalteromonas piscicida TaxID=43662 RepID=UPI003C7C9ACC